MTRLEARSAEVSVHDEATAGEARAHIAKLMSQVEDTRVANTSLSHEVVHLHLLENNAADTEQARHRVEELSGLLQRAQAANLSLTEKVAELVARNKHLEYTAGELQSHARDLRAALHTLAPGLAGAIYAIRAFALRTTEEATPLFLTIPDPEIHSFLRQYEVVDGVGLMALVEGQLAVTAMFSSAPVIRKIKLNDLLDFIKVVEPLLPNLKRYSIPGRGRTVGLGYTRKFGNGGRYYGRFLSQKI